MASGIIFCTILHVRGYTYCAEATDLQRVNVIFYMILTVFLHHK